MMDFNEPSLKYIFKTSLKIGKACQMLQQTAHKLEYDYDEELPMKQEFIDDVVKELLNIAKFLSKHENIGE